MSNVASENGSLALIHSWMTAAFSSTKVRAPCIYKQAAHFKQFLENHPKLAYSLIISSATVSSYILAKKLLWLYSLKDCIIGDHSSEVPRTIHDIRRQLTYPTVILNGWYHLCDSDELKPGDVKEIRALGRVFVLWRKQDGTPVCQDAFCPHLGANIAVGGTVVDDCIQCPFHKWTFDDSGSVTGIPYAKDKSCSVTRKLTTYEVVDYCSLVYVYYSADNEPSDFKLPSYLSDELKEGQWLMNRKWNAGFHTCNVIDWVDQASDHSHFNTLHNTFLIPWTTIPIPAWIQKIVPLGIFHEVVTHRGDDEAWRSMVEETGKYWTGKHFLFFSNYTGITWADKRLTTSASQTMEVYLGPSNIVMNIPFTIGEFKIFFTMLPVEGGTILRVRNWIDRRVYMNPFIRMLCWVLQGIASNQLWSDIAILDNKIRLTKPVIQAGDGPWSRVNTWKNIFYSASSDNADKGPYRNDW